jgi:hypothetical protein
VRVSGTTGKRNNYVHRGKKLTGVGAMEFQDVLKHSLIPDAEGIFENADENDEGGEWQLLMDRAPAHTAHSTQQWLRREKIQVVAKWPGSSPDLNPIENVWGWMKNRINKQDIKTLQQLNTTIDEAWAALPDNMLTKLMAGMSKRLNKVLGNNGQYIGM